MESLHSSFYDDTYAVGDGGAWFRDDSSFEVVVHAPPAPVLRSATHDTVRLFCEGAPLSGPPEAVQRFVQLWVLLPQLEFMQVCHLLSWVALL